MAIPKNFENLITSFIRQSEDMWIDHAVLRQILVGKYGLSNELVSEIQAGAKDSPEWRAKALATFAGWELFVRRSVDSILNDPKPHMEIEEPG